MELEETVLNSNVADLALFKEDIKGFALSGQTFRF